MTAAAGGAEGGEGLAVAFVAGRLPGVAEGDPVWVRRRTTSIDGVINQAADSYFTLATAERNPGLVTGFWPTLMIK